MPADAKRSEVVLALSSDLSLLDVVRGGVGLVALQNDFDEAATLNLQYAVEQACRLIIAEHYGGRSDQTVTLHLEAFADRLEIMLEDSGTPSELDTSSPRAFLIARGVDRVTQEHFPEAGNRLTLVKYHSRT